MLRVIERLLPAGLHRSGLRWAHHIRHHWRRFRKTPIAGCNVIVTDLSGNILMLRHSYGPDNWALPGGGVGRSEDPAEAAKRELMEELRLKAENLRTLFEVHSEVSGSPLTVYFFSLVSDQHPKPDNREVIEARFFPPHSLPEPMSDIARRALDIWRRAGREES